MVIRTWTYSISASHDGVNSGIQSTQFDLALELSGSRCPVRGKVLAVTTPRSEELHQPQIIRVQHQILKVGVSQLNDIIRASLLQKEGKKSESQQRNYDN